VHDRLTGIRARSERIPPHAYFVVSAVFHYLGPAFAVLLFARVDALGVAWLRIASAALIFAAWRRPWRVWRGLDRGTRGLLVGWAAVLAVMNSCFYLAIERLPLGTVAAVEFLPVIAVAALGSRTGRNAVALLLAVGGVYLLTDVRLVAQPWGFAFAAANAVLFALYIVLGHRVARSGRVSGIDGLALSMGIAAVVALPIGIADAAPALLDPVALAAGVGVGITSSVVPYVCDQLAMSRLSRAAYALMVALLPATATVIGILVLAQLPAPLEVLGVALVVAGVALRREAAPGGGARPTPLAAAGGGGQAGAMTDVLRYAAFTTDPAGGNPAGVVLDADALTDADMQRIAADVGYSETAFLVPLEDRRYRVRYFSPLVEVPFCGHATIASAVALAERDGVGDLVFETPAGTIPVATSKPDAVRASLVSVPTRSRPATAEEVADALAVLRWSPDDLHPDWPPHVAFGGVEHLVLAAGTRERLADLDYDFAGLGELMRERGWTTVQLFWPRDEDTVHARDPFPVGGVVEDPATGAAAAAFGGYLRALGRVPQPRRITVVQGEDMGRRSVLLVDVRPDDPRVTVSGAASAMPG
jgi:inner membrane transporter RhtA